MIGFKNKIIILISSRGTKKSQFREKKPMGTFFTFSREIGFSSYCATICEWYVQVINWKEKP